MHIGLATVRTTPSCNVVPAPLFSRGVAPKTMIEVECPFPGTRGVWVRANREDCEIGTAAL